MKRRNGFGSRERGINLVGHLRDKYENTYISCSNSLENLIEENLPKRLKSLSKILARVARKQIMKDQLRLTCRKIAELISYEIRNDGCDIVDERWNCDIDDANIRKNFNSGENVFIVVNYKTTYQNKEIKALEKRVLKRYKIRIKFNLPQNKGGSFFIPKLQLTL